MNKYQLCEKCPDEDTERCQSCRPEKHQDEIKLTYTFTVKRANHDISIIHKDLDMMVNAGGLEVLRSTLESQAEVSEHDYEQGSSREPE